MARIKHFLSLCLLLCISITASAQDFEVDGIYYEITSATDKTVEACSPPLGESPSKEYVGSITIPSTVAHNGITYSVTGIGNYAFYWCSGLTSITIPNSVVYIGDRAFKRCSSLTSVTIPNSVTSIGFEAFSWCTGLTSYNGKFASDDHRCLIKDGELLAFAPNAVTTYSIPNTVTSIGPEAFAWYDGLTSVTIPNSVTSIARYAFFKCSGLTSVTIPNSVTSIGDSAFDDCSGLTSVTISNSLTSIEWHVFRDCSGLTSVTIPNSVTNIEYGAFSDCTGLQKIVLKTDTPPSIWEEGTFNNIDKSMCDVYVPKNSVDAYKAAEGWGDFAYILADEDDATTIGLTPALSSKEGAAYNLNGQQVDEDYKGVVVKNGHAVVNNK